jgi:hypothetical protein
MLKDKMKILIPYLMFLLLIISPYNVSALDCNLFVNKAKQYSFSGETPQPWAYVKIGNEGKEYCVFEYNNQKGASKTLIIDSNGKRALNQSCGLWCETNSDLQAVEFTYLTTQHVENNFQLIQDTLDGISTDFISNAHKYSSSLDSIIDGVNYIINNVGIEPIKVGKFSIDLSEPLRKFAVEKISYYRNPDWNDIIERYNTLRGSIISFNTRVKSGFVSYDYQIKPFYENIISVQKFIEVVDEKTDSNLNEKFGSLNFYQLGNALSSQSLQEINNIENRVGSKKKEAIESKGFAETELLLLSDEIGNAMHKQIDLTKFKDGYCALKGSYPSESMITVENFQDYIDANGKIKDGAKGLKEELVELQKNAQSNFWGFIPAFIWSFYKGC